MSDEALIIPYDQLQPETLQALIEEFVTRDGMECGSGEFALEQKVAQVMAQLEKGKAVIVYDEETETCNIISKL